MALAIEFQNVSAGYNRDVSVLVDVSLRVEAGRMIGICGPNGSGKTTLLRLIQGLLPVVNGSASVFGMDLVAANYRLIRRRIACVFQSLKIDPNVPVTAWEAAMMGRYGALGLFRGPGSADRDAVEAAMRQVDALHLLHRPLGLLSGGERQRVNLARALAQEPQLLLLDEPTTFLDAESQDAIVQTIRGAHDKNGLTTLVVSHDSDVLSSLCEQIVCVREGRVLSESDRQAD